MADATDRHTADERGAADEARGGALRDPARHRRAGGDARAVLRLPARRRPPPDRGRARASRRRSRSSRPPPCSAARSRASSSRPDLVPSDLVGTRVFRPDTHDFDTELGPVFCNFLLADEINRAPAKVQSALLEVMQERQVTIGHTTHPVPDPFLVLATQNPIESEGTYPLPEAQVDRFMLKVLVDYPAHDEELTVVQRSLEPAADAPAGALDRASSRRSRRWSARSSSTRRCQLGRRPRHRDPQAGRPRPRRDRSVHLLRREPSRADQRGRRRARARGAARAGLRPAGRRRGRRPRRLPAPARPLLPGARGGGHRRPGARPRPGRVRSAADRPRPASARGRREGTSRRRRARADARPPGPRPDHGREPRGSRARDRPAGRRAARRRLPLGVRRASAPSSTRCGRTRQATTSAGSTGTSPRAPARRTSASSSPSASSSRGSSTTPRPRWPSARPSGARPTSPRESRSPSGTRATRRGNRLGLVAFGPDDPRWRRPRQGRRGPAPHARGAARGARPGTAASPTRSRSSTGSPSSARSSSSSPTSAARSTGGTPLLRVAGRHPTLAVEIRDPREQELADVGELRLVDPETGRQLRVDTSDRKLRERFAEAAAEERTGLVRMLAAAGVRHVALSTEGDWLRQLAAFLKRSDGLMLALSVRSRFKSPWLLLFLLLVPDRRSGSTSGSTGAARDRAAQLVLAGAACRTWSPARPGRAGTSR